MEGEKGGWEVSPAASLVHPAEWRKGKSEEDPLRGSGKERGRGEGSVEGILGPVRFPGGVPLGLSGLDAGGDK